MPLKRDRAVGPSALCTSSDLLTAKELEALLKIDVKTIYSYVQRGLIPYVRIQSNVRFVREQILEWISERNFTPAAVSGRSSKRL